MPKIEALLTSSAKNHNFLGNQTAIQQKITTFWENEQQLSNQSGKQEH